MRAVVVDDHVCVGNCSGERGCAFSGDFDMTIFTGEVDVVASRDMITVGICSACVPNNNEEKVVVCTRSHKVHDCIHQLHGHWERIEIFPVTIEDRAKGTHPPKIRCIFGETDVNRVVFLLKSRIPDLEIVSV